MNTERLFQATANGLEKITRIDLALLRSVGIKKPFFKTEQGFNTVVVYGYKEGSGRFVAKFKSQSNPPFDAYTAGNLRKRFCVAGFLGRFDISKKNLSYRRWDKETVLSHWEKENWVGYDFSIRIRAAALLLNKCRFDLGCCAGKTGVSVLTGVGLASGKTFGKLCNNGLVYDEFRPDNLGGEDEACFFDISISNGKTAFWRTNNVDTRMESADSFFRFAKVTVSSIVKDRSQAKIIDSLLKKGFVEGLEISEADQTMIKKVRTKFEGFETEILDAR